MSDSKKHYDKAGRLLNNWSLHQDKHIKRMQDLYLLAQQAGLKGETPVAASLWKGDVCLAVDHNRVEELQDPMMHAEYIVIRMFIEQQKKCYLDQCVLYVTLLPCTMCQAFLKRMRLGSLCYGAASPENNEHFLLSCPVWGGVLEQECGQLLTQFFQEKRL